MHLFISEVEETICEADILSCFLRLAYFKRKILRTRIKYGKGINLNLKFARCDFWVNGFLVTLNHCTLNADYALLTKMINQIVVIYYNLSHAVLITQINECNAAVVTNCVNPAGELDSLVKIIKSKFVTIMCSVSHI